MNTISSYNANAAPATNGTQQTSAVATTAETDTQTDDSQSSISSRAENLAKLNSEFDITNPSFRLSQQFINRMAELNLISQQEAEGLGSGLPVNSSGDSSTDTVEELSNAIDKLSNNHSDDQTLIEILASSKQVLNNLDGSKQDSLPTDPYSLAVDLANYLKSDSANSLSESEKETLSDLKLAMEIADKISPEKRSSAELSKYMEVLKAWQ